MVFAIGPKIHSQTAPKNKKKYPAKDYKSTFSNRVAFEKEAAGGRSPFSSSFAAALLHFLPLLVSNNSLN